LAWPQEKEEELEQKQREMRQRLLVAGNAAAADALLVRPQSFDWACDFKARDTRGADQTQRGRMAKLLRGSVACAKRPANHYRVRKRNRPCVEASRPVVVCTVPECVMTSVSNVYAGLV